MNEKKVEGGVSTYDDFAGDDLGEGARMVTFMAEMRPKVINQYFIWFPHFLMYVTVNLSGFTLLEWSELVTMMG